MPLSTPYSLLSRPQYSFSPLPTTSTSSLTLRAAVLASQFYDSQEPEPLTSPQRLPVAMSRPVATEALSDLILAPAAKITIAWVIIPLPTTSPVPYDSPHN